MTAMGSLEYAHARLSARLGARPDDLAWRRVEPVRDLAPFIDAARASALRPWMTGIGSASTPHEIEALLRRRWRELVAEVARWMPDAWQSAIRWCAIVADLPAIEHLARGGEPTRGMREDPVLRDLAAGAGDRTGDVPRPGTLAALVVDRERIGGAWHASWRRLLPAGAAHPPSILADVERAIALHLSAMRDPALIDGTPLRRALEARLVLLFRRATLDPAAAFALLAIVALDVERLRGELVRRAAFPRALLPEGRAA